MDVIHTAVEVADLTETRAFYEDALGLSFDREFTEDGIRNYYVSGEGVAGIQFRHDFDGAGSIEPAGIHHLAIEVDDLGATFQRLVDLTDCEVVEEPTEDDDNRKAFVRDPDGYVVELLEFFD
jgi:lactoylglutathione lyase